MSSRLAVLTRPTRLIPLPVAGLTTPYRRACSLGAARALQMTSRHTHPAALPAGARHRARARTGSAGKPTPRLSSTDMRGHAALSGPARSTMLVLRDASFLPGVAAARARGAVDENWQGGWSWVMGSWVVEADLASRGPGTLVALASRLLGTCTCMRIGT
jgi:hypothetical protein